MDLRSNRIVVAGVRATMTGHREAWRSLFGRLLTAQIKPSRLLTMTIKSSRQGENVFSSQKSLNNERSFNIDIRTARSVNCHSKLYGGVVFRTSSIPQ
jgi:hypothetical protein